MRGVFLSPRFHEALELAAFGHRSQPRKGTDIPYIVHPVAVACLVYQYGGNEEAVIAGLLHDLPEDTDITLNQIRGAFGEEVAAIVSGLTENKSLPWVMRKRGSIAKYQATNDNTRLVAGADKLTALIGFARDPTSREDTYWDRFNASRSLQAWYYHSLAHVLASVPFADEFRQLTAQVFGPSPPNENPCGLYVEYALKKRGERGSDNRLEARTLWLNAEDEDREAMAAVIDSLVADVDAETAAPAASFLGFVGKSSTIADARLISILKNETRPAVLAAALVATEVILSDALEGSPSVQGLLTAREALAGDKARAAQVVEHLSMLVDERAVEEIQNALRFLKGA